MNFLHLLSSEAVQHVIIHCLNVSVWRSAEDGLLAQGSVRFKAWTGEVFEAGGELEPDVLEDSCWVGMRYWHVSDGMVLHHSSWVCFGLTDKRWTLAPDPFCVPLPGPHLASCSWHLQPSENNSRLSLPPRSGSRLLPVRSSCEHGGLDSAGCVRAGSETITVFKSWPKKKAILPPTQQNPTWLQKQREETIVGGCHWGVLAL